MSCTGLSQRLPERSGNTDALYVLWKAQVFCRNPRLTAIHAEKGNSFYCSVDGVLFSADRKKLIYFPDGKDAGGTYAIPEGTEEIGLTAFTDPAVAEITFPESLPEIYREDVLKTVNREKVLPENPWASPMLWAGAVVLLLAAAGFALHLSREKAIR